MLVCCNGITDEDSACEWTDQDGKALGREDT